PHGWARDSVHGPSSLKVTPLQLSIGLYLMLEPSTQYIAELIWVDTCSRPFELDVSGGQNLAHSEVTLGDHPTPKGLALFELELADGSDAASKRCKDAVAPINNRAQFAGVGRHTVVPPLHSLV